MPPPGIVIAIALDAVVLLTVSVLAGYWWLTRLADESDRSNAPGDWYAEATALAGEIQRAVEHTGAVADHDAVQRRVVPLAGRIRSHVRAAPRGVDECHVRQLSDLGEACYAVGMEHTTRDAARTGEFLEDRLADLGERAGAFETAVAARAGADAHAETDSATGTDG